MRTLSLAVCLILFWLALSGHFTPFLLGAGVLSVIVSVLAAHRMGALDSEGHPIELFAGAITYVPWLVLEIVKSAWTVTLIILDPRLPTSATLTRVRASQRTGAGIAVYANSITLTPGTITMTVKGDVLTVHALTCEGAIDLEHGAMDARVRAVEGGA
jgi:multicomponent Na+:H+ antiporter subunit E